MKQLYTGYYITPCGKVYSHKTQKFLIPFTDKFGRKRVHLCFNGKQKSYSIHRLVAKCWLDNPSNLPVINHKDENPSNNRIDNLEWCTQKYNINYGTTQERRIATRYGVHNETDRNVT